MRTISVKLLVFLGVVVFLLNAQTSSNPFGGDPFGGLSVDSILPPPIPETTTDPYAVPDTTSGVTPASTSASETPVAEPVASQESTSPIEQAPLPNDMRQTTNLFTEIESSGLESPVQNAVIEGIQITADKGATSDEKIISGYFIFRDKPSSYFYEVKLREKKIVFEFNDTKTGASPVPSVSEAPIKGFTIVSDKVDINKDVKGLKPEYHNLIRVIFDLEGVPEIKVNDEYSIITFSFKWSNNPQMVSKYTVKDKTPIIILWSSVGVGVAGAGALTYFLLSKPEETPPLGDLTIDDLPARP